MSTQRVMRLELTLEARRRINQRLDEARATRVADAVRAVRADLARQAATLAGAAQPAAQPASRPAARPAAQPTARPAAQPTARSTAGPARRELAEEAVARAVVLGDPELVRRARGDVPAAFSGAREMGDLDKDVVEFAYSAAHVELRRQLGLSRG